MWFWYLWLLSSSASNVAETAIKKTSGKTALESGTKKIGNLAADKIINIFKERSKTQDKTRQDTRQDKPVGNLIVKKLTGAKN